MNPCELPDIGDKHDLDELVDLGDVVTETKATDPQGMFDGGLPPNSRFIV